MPLALSRPRVHASSTRPRARVLPGAALTDAEVADCFAIRGLSVESRPGEPPDLAYFSKALRACSLVTLMVAEGRLVGFLGIHLDRGRWEGGNGWMFELDFAFVLPAWRGRIPYARPTLLALGRRWLRAPHEPIFLCGAAYPASYCNVGASFGTPVTPADDPSTDPAAHGLAVHLTRTRFADRYDPVLHRVRMPCIPGAREAARRWTEPRRAALFARYEALNPTWREGFGLPIAARMRLVPCVLRWVGVR